MHNLLQKHKGQVHHAPPGMSRGLTRAGRQVLVCSCACLRHAQKEAQKGLRCSQIRCLSRWSVTAGPQQEAAGGVTAVECWVLRFGASELEA